MFNCLSVCIILLLLQLLLRCFVFTSFFDRLLPGEEIQLCLFITFSPENVSFQVEKELETK